MKTINPQIQKGQQLNHKAHEEMAPKYIILGLTSAIHILKLKQNISYAREKENLKKYYTAKMNKNDKRLLV